MPGGVCAVLDYEVPVMAEYVSEMAMRVVSPETVVSDHFQKFVSQILTSTRLPRTTILLGLNYLAKRINSQRSQGQTVDTSERNVWHLITIALLLGSKFLDDNTFQNKSWSEVSGIGVKDLNRMEIEWIASCQWQLYVNLDTSQDYTAWLENWETWYANKKSQAVLAAQATRTQRFQNLSPIQTTFMPHGLPSPPYRPVVSTVDMAHYNAKEFAQAQVYRPQESVWGQSQHHSGHAAPITPPDSGYTTPEYVSSATSSSMQLQDWFAQASALQQFPALGQSQNHISPYARQSGNQSSGHGRFSYWDHMECSTSSKPAYFIPTTYAQPVMG